MQPRHPQEQALGTCICCLLWLMYPSATADPHSGIPNWMLVADLYLDGGCQSAHWAHASLKTHKS